MPNEALIGALLLVTGATVAQAVGQRVNVNGMRMYYEVSGTGDPFGEETDRAREGADGVALITQVDLLHGFIEPFLKGETPKGFFQP